MKRLLILCLMLMTPSVTVQGGWLESFNLGLEVGAPIINKVRGMQKDENYLVQVGLSYSH